MLVNPDAVHTYHYIPDVAAGLMTLGCADSDVYGRPWMLPCVRLGTMRELVARSSRKLAVTMPRGSCGALFHRFPHTPAFPPCYGSSCLSAVGKTDDPDS